ncbi:hypothetical protein HMPREF0322_00280 [Desulfitobacterium hafniense DP7]|uniref:Chromosome segregation ATPase n=1 Tax=Desulfitobacterium hafniense DP7 TaxID=537010 RepID=G9XH57_DESHA|nr:hypothetical protein [Desulfitobacterium hafniense]EHL09005.1 hypothetical protein HMPREF0322_00280 [Desulfitobacterium hafniense DP7]
MPLLNRIRIINFSYNNDTRLIMDECFDFHGGESALLNLANGGGKSVLVQLFLQPIVPEVRIQGRKMAGFFRKQKQPTFILLEWKLDGGGGYLLTGMGIVPAQAATGEEISGKIRYFTFTCKYHGANAFDIRHIPLAEKKENLLHLLSFREARELMRDKQQKDPYLFGYFPQDEGADYGRHLAEFGIIQDEWRNVIAKINDSEGGIDEIFQKYKTSGQLLDEWIIKNIEKSMSKDQAELHRLEDMLEKLVQEVAENESYLLEREVLAGFLKVYAEQSKGLATLLEGLEQQRELGEKLTALHGYLRHQGEGLVQKQEENDQAQAFTRREEQRIELEERSQDYLLKKNAHIRSQELLQGVQERLRSTEERLAEAQAAEKIQQAARLWGDIRHKEGKRSGIEEILTARQTDFDQDRRIGELEYTLKTLLEKEQANLAEEERRLQGEQTQAGASLQEVQQSLKDAESRQRALAQEKGRLSERKKQLENQNGAALKKLNLQLRRNILGELNQAETEKIKSRLDQDLADLQRIEKELTTEHAANVQAITGLEGESRSLQTRQTEENNTLLSLRRDIREYEEREAEVKSIVTRYDLDSAWLFQRERLDQVFGQKIQDLADRVEQAGITWHEAQENLLSLKSGRLHVPAEVAALLAEAGIQYDTGEAYLRGLSPELSAKMLRSNPLLPYAFILSRQDLQQISATLESLTLSRIIPFIPYEDLNLTMVSNGRLVQGESGVTLACLYEGRVFERSAMAKLVGELEEKSVQASREREHYSEEHRRVVSDQAVCAKFTYPADHRYNLGRAEQEAEVRLSGLIEQLAQASQKVSGLQERNETINRELRRNQSEQATAQTRIELFREFLLKEAEYQECGKELTKVGDELQKLEAQKNHWVEEQERLRGKLAEISRELWQNDDTLQKILKQYELYRQSPVAPLVAGSLEELTARLQALKSQYGSELEQLEQQKRELTMDIQQLKGELRKLKLQEEEYASVPYREEKADGLRAEIEDLASAVRGLRPQEIKAAREEAAAKTALDMALTEVKRLGWENPLGPEEISGDFPLRRRQAQKRLQELGQESRELQRKKALYERLQDQIDQTLDTQGLKAAPDFSPGEDLEAQTKDLQQGYQKQDRQNRQDVRGLRNSYGRLKEDYREKNLNIDTIFRALDHLWEDAQGEEDEGDRGLLSFDRFYFLFESMSIHQEKLADLLQVYELQLANLERNKKDMVEQSFLHGLRICEEIQWISDHSRIRLQGRSRPVQMLKIDLVTDSSENARERMQHYIEAGIEKVRQEIRQNKRPEEIRKSVIKLMSSRELLNTYLGNSHIPISVYKIDLNPQNSGLKLWEDAAHQNSGGEKFVVFFSVLSALMSYARTRAMENLGGVAEKESSSVLIMDNPFGPISSEHLLNPLFEIARKHRTQLICLSDLKQNSIMNCFNLIYMLKIRTTAMGNKEYLKFEEIIRDSADFQEDERLEKAVFRSEVRQMAIFGEE